MEEDAKLHDKNTDNLGGEPRALLLSQGKISRSLRLGENNAVSDVFDEERHENASHNEGGCGSLVTQVADTLIAEHEEGMGVELTVWVRNGRQ